MIITHNREKLINAIIYFAKKTKHCGKTKLLKLLYFFDFCHFKYTAQSVTGLEYFAWEHGPVPTILYEELNDPNPDLKAAVNIDTIETFQKIVPKKKFDNKFYTKREKDLMEELACIFKDAIAEDMVRVTHLKDDPWDKTLKEKGPFKKIDYMLAIDKMNGGLSYDEAKERTEEISEMHEIFGTI